MKRFVVGVLVGALLFAVPAWAQNHIRLIVNGFEVQSDVPPQIVGGRVMVPIRVVSEQFGAQVSWDEAARTVTIRGGNLPDYVACEMFQAIVNQADQIKLLNEGLALVSEIAVSEVEPSRRQAIRDLAAAGQVMADQATETERNMRDVIAKYCPTETSQ